MDSSNSSIPPQSCCKISRTHTSARHMGQRCNMQRHPTTPPCLIRRGKNHSGGHRSIPFSCASSGFDNANPTQCYCVQTGGSYGKHDANMPPVFRRRSIAVRCHCHLPGQRYVTCDPQQRVLSLGTKSLKQSRWPYVHGRHEGDPHKQWGGIKYFANY
jgi:hypothetical protein